MSKIKYDMSDKCGFLYEEPRTPEWEQWYMENCDKCCYMCEICMYGEEPVMEVIKNERPEEN